MGDAKFRTGVPISRVLVHICTNACSPGYYIAAIRCYAANDHSMQKLLILIKGCCKLPTLSFVLGHFVQCNRLDAFRMLRLQFKRCASDTVRFRQSELLDGYNKSHKQFHFRLRTGLRNSRSSLRQSTVKSVDID